jgi:hypothetical protein
MGVIGLSGTVVVIGGATFLFLRLINISNTKKHKRKHIWVQGSNFVVIDDGGAHLDVGNNCDIA